jgi:hypothetical protein
MNNIIPKEEKDNIDALCKKYLIKNYTINPDGSIDVDGDVGLTDHTFTSLPLRFGKVSGGFSCTHGSLTSLEGCPKKVGKTFDCSYNLLSSLEFCPSEIGEEFFCYGGYWDLDDIYETFEKDEILTNEEKKIFVRYQSYYDVWTPGFNVEGFNELIAEIKDGLQ